MQQTCVELIEDEKEPQRASHSDLILTIQLYIYL